MAATIVIAATRKDGCVGYFKRLEDVPQTFRYPGPKDISDVMGSFRSTDVDYVLSRMNEHWIKGAGC